MKKKSEYDIGYTDGVNCACAVFFIVLGFGALLIHYIGG